MNAKMLEWALRNAEESIRMMARDKSAMHVFDLGKDQMGKEYVMMIAVLPKGAIPEFALKPSEPLEQ